MSKMIQKAKGYGQLFLLFVGFLSGIGLVITCGGGGGGGQGVTSAAATISFSPLTVPQILDLSGNSIFAFDTDRTPPALRGVTNVQDALNRLNLLLSPELSQGFDPGSGLGLAQAPPILQIDTDNVAAPEDRKILTFSRRLKSLVTAGSIADDVVVNSSLRVRRIAGPPPQQINDVFSFQTFESGAPISRLRIKNVAGTVAFTVDNGNLALTGGNLTVTGGLTSLGVLTAGATTATTVSATTVVNTPVLNSTTINNAGTINTTDLNVTNDVTFVNVEATDIAVSNNVTVANDLTATGDVNAANLNATTNVVAGGNVTATGDVGGTNVNATTNVSAGADVSAGGDVNGTNLNATNNVVAINNVNAGGDVNAANVNATNMVTADNVAANTGTFTGTVSVGDLSTAGTLSAANFTATGTVSAATVTATVMVGAPLIASTGDVTADGNLLAPTGNVVASGLVAGTSTPVANSVVADNDLIAGGDLSVTGNGTIAGNGTITGNLDVGDSVGGTGDLSVVNMATIGGDLNVGGEINLTGNGTFSADLAVVNVNASGDVTAANFGTAGDVVAGNGIVAGASTPVDDTVIADLDVIAVGGNVIATAGDLVATAGNVVAAAGSVQAASATLTGSLEADSATITNAVSADSATIANAINAGSATITGTIGAASVSLSGNIGAASATITGAVGAASATFTGAVGADSATITNAINAGSASVGGDVEAGSDVIAGGAFRVRPATDDVVVIGPGTGNHGQIDVFEATGTTPIFTVERDPASPTADNGLVTVNTEGATTIQLIGSTGDVAGVTKSFVQPHPTDSSKMIQYVCLEGPENTVYARGTAQLVNGQSMVQLPESFALVANDEGLSVVLTPLDDCMGLYAPRAELGRTSFRVRELFNGASSTEFSWVVYGVRRGFEVANDIRPNTFFVPSISGEPMYSALPGLRNILIENGTLKADGTPSEQTAQQNGWALKSRLDLQRERREGKPIERR